MITITYDPRVGAAIADGDCEAVVLSMMLNADTGMSDQLTVSTENIILAFRVAIREARLRSEEFVLEYSGNQYYFDNDGMMSFWPDGLCDTCEKYLIRLLN